MKLHHMMGAAVVAGLIATSGHAAPLCSYQHYAIDGTVQYLADGLRATGLQLIPDHQQGQFQVFDLSGRAPALVGIWQVETDPYERTKSINVLTADGAPLVTIEESIGYCDDRPSPTTCFETNYRLRGEDTNSPAYSIEQGRYGLRHYRYGREVNVTSWRYDMHDMREWIIGFYLTTDRIDYEIPPYVADAIAFQASIDPLLFPYADFYSIIWLADGSVLLSGVVPSNASYSALVGLLIDHGIYNFDDRLIIDTGLIGKPLPFSDPLGYCL